jgi:hypothetical protein
MLKLRIQYLLHNFYKVRNNMRLKKNESVMNMLITVRGFVYWDGCLCTTWDGKLSSVDNHISLRSMTRHEANDVIKSTLKLHPSNVNITNLRIFISQLISQTLGDHRIIDAYKSMGCGDTVTSGYYKVLEAFRDDEYIKVNDNLTNIKVLLNGFLTSGL